MATHARGKVIKPIEVEPITLPYRFSPRDYQLDFFKAMDNPEIRTFLLRWCRRCGKDKTCLAILGKKMMERVGSYYYVFPEYSQARKAVWEGIDSINKMKFLDHIPEALRSKVNNNEMKIELVNGSILRLVGADNIDSLMGTNPIGIIYSEYAIQKPEAREYLSPILAQNHGWEVLQGTPRGKNHMWKTEQALLGDSKSYVSVVQTLWPDRENYYEVLTPEELQREVLKGIGLDTIEQEYGVSYAAGVQGTYYADQITTAIKSGRIGKFPYNDQLYVDLFLDIGVIDGTAIWFKQQDGRANIFIDYHETSGKTIFQTVDDLKAKGYKYRNIVLPHDSVRKLHTGERVTTYKDLLREALANADIEANVLVASKPFDKQMAIEKTRARFSSYFFDEDKCNDGLTKLALYHRVWNREKQCFGNEAVHDYCSHAADALTTESLSAEQQDDIVYGNNKSIDMLTDFDPWDN